MARQLIEKLSPWLLMTGLAVLTGCATPYDGLSIREGTITQARQALRPVSANGDAAMVPYSQVAFIDDATGEEFRGALDGRWKVGKKLKFSVSPDGNIIIRRSL